MRWHKEEPDGPPCAHMETFLQGAADGRAKGLARWYALAHAARCGRCARYLDRLSETLGHLRQAKSSHENSEALRRLAAGSWRDHGPA